MHQPQTLLDLEAQAASGLFFFPFSSSALPLSHLHSSGSLLNPTKGRRGNKCWQFHTMIFTACDTQRKKRIYNQSPGGHLTDTVLDMCMSLNHSFWSGERGSLMANPGARLPLWLVCDGVSPTNYPIHAIHRKKFCTKEKGKGRGGKQARKTRL